MLQLLQLPVCPEDDANDPARTQPTFVVEQIRRMRGGAQSHLMRSRDNDYYVVKFQGNPQGTRILVNELLGTLLAARLGLPTTPVAVCFVSEELIRLTHDLCFETPSHALHQHRIPCSPGLQFGSRYPVDPHRVVVFDFLPDKQLRAVKNLSDFLGMLVFDKWTCNTDGRQTIFYQTKVGAPFYLSETEPPYQCVIGGPYKTEMIDQGACFNGGEWNFPDAPLRGLYARSAVYEQVHGIDDFDPWLTRLEQINEGVLTEIAKTIPPEWYDADFDSLQRLLEQLHRRRSRVRELLWDTWKARPYAFPNWRSQGTSDTAYWILHETKGGSTMRESTRETTLGLYLEKVEEVGTSQRDPGLPKLDFVRGAYIQYVLGMCGGNRLRTAQILGIGRTSLYRFLRQSEENETKNQVRTAPDPKLGAILKRLLAVFLCFAVVTLAQGGKSFDRIRYDGGSIISTFDKLDDWEGKLTVNADAIFLTLKDGQSVTIPPKQVTVLSYGQESNRHVKPKFPLVVVSVSVWDVFRDTKLRYIGINYTDKDGKKQGLLLEAHKSNFRAIIQALQGVTGASVWVSEKERREIPAGITVQITKKPGSAGVAE